LASVEEHLVIILSGAGGNLSAGSDISQFPQHRTGIRLADEYNAAIDAALSAVGEVPHPVIAAITGMAVGGGCELACAADLRVVAKDARFGVPIARLGVSVGPIEVRTMLRVLSPGHLKDLLLTGRLIDAEEAARIGLADRVVAPEEVEATAEELARTIGAGAPLSAMANKLAVNAVADGRLDEARERLRDLTVAIYDGPDFQEGIRAFMEKRSPRFDRRSRE
jgi:enoyl-CoA hydratase